MTTNNITTLTTTRTPPAIIGRTFGELAAQDWPEPEFVIRPWLRQGESALIWAAAGVGKTMLVQTLALMVAGGGKALGWEAPEPRKVLIIDGEMPERDIAQRLIWLSGFVDGLDLEAAYRNIEVRGRQMQGVETRFYDITDEASQQAIMRDVADNDIDLLVLDNLTTLCDGMGDENDVASMRPVLSFLMNLKKLKVAVIAVHHANKGGRQFRGSSAIETTFEVSMGLTKPDAAASGKASFRAEFGKFRQRRDSSVEPRVFTLEDFGWKAQGDAPDETERLLEAIRSCRFATQQAAGASIGVRDKGKVSRMLSRAVQAGRTTQGQIGECLKSAAKGRAAGDADEPL